MPTFHTLNSNGPLSLFVDLRCIPLICLYKIACVFCWPTISKERVHENVLQTLADLKSGSPPSQCPGTRQYSRCGSQT